MSDALLSRCGGTRELVLELADSRAQSPVSDGAEHRRQHDAKQRGQQDDETQRALELPCEEADHDGAVVLDRKDGNRRAEQRHQKVRQAHQLPLVLCPSALRKRWMMRSWLARPVGESPAPFMNSRTGTTALAIVRWPPAEPRSPNAARVTSPALFT